VIGCFYDGSSRADGPDFTLPRETVRQWKADGKGVFCSSGRYFQLLTPLLIENAPTPLHQGNMVSFSRQQRQVNGLYLKPDSINYPIPACGDHRLQWRFAFMQAHA